MRSHGKWKIQFFKFPDQSTISSLSTWASGPLILVHHVVPWNRFLSDFQLPQSKFQRSRLKTLFFNLLPILRSLGTGETDRPIDLGISAAINF